jgi:nucleotide-binding universal stress UspA family protein
MSNTPVLICYDGSKSAEHAIDVAAGMLGPRHAVVLDVGPPITLTESLAVTSPFSPDTTFEEYNETDTEERAKAGAERARKAGFTADARSMLGAPTWKGIVDAADEIEAELIVIGTRGLGGVREAVEGSVSHQVAEHSDRPVLIIPLKD